MIEVLPSHSDNVLAFRLSFSGGGLDMHSTHRIGAVVLAVVGTVASGSGLRCDDSPHRCFADAGGVGRWKNAGGRGRAEFDPVVEGSQQFLAGPIFVHAFRAMGGRTIGGGKIQKRGRAEHPVQAGKQRGIV